MNKGQVIAFISAPGVGTSFLTKQMACRHSDPAFFEGEEGIFTPEVLSVLNNEKDSPGRYEWLCERTKTMLTKAHAIASLGTDSYVDGDILLMEAWLNAEIGTESPEFLKNWLKENKHLMADKVVILTASPEKIKENMVRRGRVSEQTDFIKERAMRVNKACVDLQNKYKHVKVIDRTNLEFTETKTLEFIDDVIKNLPTC